MSIANLAAEIFMKKIGGSGDSGNIASALTGLLGGNNSGGAGDLDIMGLVSKLQSGDMSSMVSSWLGDGSNDSISTDQVTNMLGESKISEFASKLGVDPSTALNGLKDTIPDVIDQSSSGGSLLDSIGGLSGALNIAKKLF
ncbi:MAG: YidB family protein [Gammaproteobacteria bacterium]|nr:YidB family protein [Gammaproteobacteria bacterium]